MSKSNKKDPWLEIGFVPLKAIIGPLPISNSSWWDGVTKGRYPKPVKFGPRITARRVDGLRKLTQAE